MHKEDALALIRELVALGAFRFTRSCKDGMHEHGILTTDVYALIATAGCSAQVNGTWRFEGATESGDDAFRVVVALRVTPAREVRFVSAHRLVERGS